MMRLLLHAPFDNVAHPAAEGFLAQLLVHDLAGELALRGELLSRGVCNLADGLDRAVHVAVPDPPADRVLGDEFSDVAGIGAEEKDRTLERHGSVDLARVADADFGVAQTDE